MKSSQFGVLAIATILATGCATQNLGTGKSETSVGKTTGLGAIVGAAAGALIGKERGAAIGAAIGASAGYVVATQLRQRELEAAIAMAEEIKQTTKYTPVVYDRDYVDTKSGKAAKKLEKVEIQASVKETIKRGRLDPSAALALAKLDRLAAQDGGKLTVALPSSELHAIKQEILYAAPTARVVQGEPGKVVATLTPKEEAEVVL